MFAEKIRNLSLAVLAAATVLAAPRGLRAQTTGNPNNPFPGTGAVTELTWGANGGACTTPGGPVDDGYTGNASIRGVTCMAAKLDVYANGWAQLAIWNLSGDPGVGGNASATINGFGLFWCEGTGAYKCPDGGDPLVGGPPPVTYNNNVNDAADGNWYPGGGSTPGQTNDPVDWRLISPTGQILVPPNTPSDPITDVEANGIGGTKGDGFHDSGVAIGSADTPFSGINAVNPSDGLPLGAYVFQFYFGTGSNYDFSTQWVVLDANFQDVTNPAHPTDPSKDFANDNFSCIDDRDIGTATGDTRSGSGTNTPCGGLSGTILSINTVPEPTSLLLLGTGLVALGPLARRRRRS